MAEFTRPDPNTSCDPRHLAALMGLQPGDVDIHKDKVIVHVTPPANAQAVIDTYVYDPAWGKPTEDVEMSKVREKAKAVAAGTDTFTAAQMQKAVAHLILRATR